LFSITPGPRARAEHLTSLDIAKWPSSRGKNSAPYCRALGLRPGGTEALGIQIKNAWLSNLKANPLHRSSDIKLRKASGFGEPFTGLFAFNDISAIGAVQALREAGLRVLRTCRLWALTTFECCFQNPALTTVRQPLREGRNRGRDSTSAHHGAPNAPYQKKSWLSRVWLCAQARPRSWLFPRYLAGP